MNDEIVRQRRNAGFLLGFGLGLVVGILFQPRGSGLLRSAGESRPSTLNAAEQWKPMK